MAWNVNKFLCEPLDFEDDHPRVIKHGLLENPLFIDDFPSYNPPFRSGDFTAMFDYPIIIKSIYIPFLLVVPPLHP
jgi:hypothetical protein